MADLYFHDFLHRRCILTPMKVSSATIASLLEDTSHQMGERAYIALTTLWVVVGLVFTTIGAALTYGMEPTWWMLLGTFILAMLGTVWTSIVKENVFLALVGYFVVAFPFGAMLGPYCAAHEANLVGVVGTTVLLSVGLGGIGVLIPKSLQSWGSYLLGGLVTLIVAQFSLILLALMGLPVSGAFTVLDWIGIGLFSIFIVYDMNQALTKTRTVANSLESAIGLYLSILNLFTRLLSTSSSKD